MQHKITSGHIGSRRLPGAMPIEQTGCMRDAFRRSGGHKSGGFTLHCNLDDLAEKIKETHKRG
jgi:hypothetical protein